MVEKLGIDYFDKNRPLAKLHGKTTLQMRRKMYDFWFFIGALADHNRIYGSCACGDY